MLYDLGFNASVQGLVDDLSFGKLYAIAESAGGDPFSPNQKSYAISLDCNVTAIEQLNANQTRQLFGVSDQVFYRLAIASPVDKSKIRTGLYGIVVSHIQGLKGIIRRIDHQISGITLVYVNVSESVPNQASSLI